MNEFKSEVMNVLNKVPIKVAAIMTSVLLNIEWFDHNSSGISDLIALFKNFNVTQKNFPEPSQAWMQDFATAHGN
jgi:hypothetical protein